MEIEWEDCISNKLNSILNSHFQSKNKVSNNIFQKKVPSSRKRKSLHILKKKTSEEYDRNQHVQILWLGNLLKERQNHPSCKTYSLEIALDLWGHCSPLF